MSEPLGLAESEWVSGKEEVLPWVKEGQAGLSIPPLINSLVTLTAKLLDFCPPCGGPG